MTSVPDSIASNSRNRLVRVFVIQGTFGLLLLFAATVVHREQTWSILAALGGDAPILILIFLLFAASLGLLRFELTDLVYTSLLITACMAMFPLLGVVLSSWIAVVTAVGARYLALRGIGPVRIAMEDANLEYVKTFALAGTYGLPVVVASWLYERIGGQTPLIEPSPAGVARAAVCGVVLILTNNLVMARVMHTYGYSIRTTVRFLLIDGAIYLMTLPYAICVALSYGSIGWPAVLALAFTGVLANLVARNLAVTRSRSQQQVKRLVSLSNIGKTISLRLSTDELLLAIYTECRKIVDVSLFSIALLDEEAKELSFALDIRDGVRLPKERIPLGAGLNSWVISHRRPLLVGSVAEERRLGLAAVADSKATESWLGVPMIARDRVVGVIAVESYHKNVFTNDDVLLLTSIANQAAVAIENARLYKDLEGLTYALEQRVMDRTNELRETNLRLMAADRSKNQFLANMSHELRTPLNSIIGFSSVLLEYAQGLLSPRHYKFLENIRTAGNHLLELINDILDLSKIEAGRMELRPDHFDLRDTIAAVERVMKGFASEANVRIMASIGDDVPKVHLDEGRLKQILFNLLSNAVKFSPAGGPVQLAVSFAGAERSPLGCGSVKIEVEDQGVGMAEEELERIFEEFYQAEGGRRARRGGTGLGLSLTRNFIELHHGTIDVRSAPGQGTVFTMYLPVDSRTDGIPRQPPIMLTSARSRPAVH
ncbi:MAG TPA: ATP-binding protein [Thermoanaerobaculia bacterium]|nr:ATP-binding protein [Thermoanaerobaculia bacterium]